MSSESSKQNLAPEQPELSKEDLLRESLKRCSPGTIEAALEFSRSGNLDLVPAIVIGIVERFLDEEAIEVLRKGGDSVKFMEDLGLDSLTMFEAIMMVEESLGISVKNEELWDLRTTGDLKAFMASKLSGVEESPRSKSFAVEQIAAAMPQQDPFLFLQTAQIEGGSATGTYAISGREAFLEGHFKDDPVFPASILLEALGQLAVFHHLTAGEPSLGDAPQNSVYFAGADGVRCHRVCRPGEVLELNVELKRAREPMVVYSGKIVVDGEKAASADDISLISAAVD